LIFSLSSNHEDRDSGLLNRGPRTRLGGPPGGRLESGGGNPGPAAAPSPPTCGLVPGLPVVLRRPAPPPAPVGPRGRWSPPWPPRVAAETVAVLPRLCPGNSAGPGVRGCSHAPRTCGSAVCPTSGPPSSIVPRPRLECSAVQEFHFPRPGRGRPSAGGRPRIRIQRCPTPSLSPRRPGADGLRPSTCVPRFPIHPTAGPSATRRRACNQRYGEIIQPPGATPRLARLVGSTWPPPYYNYSVAAPLKRPGAPILPPILSSQPQPPARPKRIPPGHRPPYNRRILLGDFQTRRLYHRESNGFPGVRRLRTPPSSFGKGAGATTWGPLLRPRPPAQPDATIDHVAGDDAESAYGMWPGATGFPQTAHPARVGLG